MRAKIFVLGLILLLTPLSGTEKADVLNHDWQSLFTEPCETIYIIMKDNKIFKDSTQNVGGVLVNAEGIKEALGNTRKYSMEDIAIVIHNHRFRRKFSSSDWQFYRDLKKRGFNGHFLMYCHISKKVYNIEDKIR